MSRGRYHGPRVRVVPVMTDDGARTGQWDVFVWGRWVTRLECLVAAYAAGQAAAVGLPDPAPRADLTPAA